MQVQGFAFPKLYFVNIHQKDPFVSAGFYFSYFMYFSTQLTGVVCSCDLHENKAVMRLNLWIELPVCSDWTRSQSQKRSLLFRKCQLS